MTIAESLRGLLSRVLERLSPTGDDRTGVAATRAATWVQYHAAVALRAAAEQLPKSDLALVRQAIERAEDEVRKRGERPDAPRDGMLAEAKDRCDARAASSA